MPAIRSVQIEDNLVTITDQKGVRILDATKLAGNLNTIAKVENFVNNTWIPANITDYACAVHVFSLNPLRVTVWTGDIGLTPPANWWTD